MALTNLNGLSLSSSGASQRAAISPVPASSGYLGLLDLGSYDRELELAGQHCVHDSSEYTASFVLILLLFLLLLLRCRAIRYQGLV